MFFHSLFTDIRGLIFFPFKRKPVLIKIAVVKHGDSQSNQYFQSTTMLISGLDQIDTPPLSELSSKNPDMPGEGGNLSPNQQIILTLAQKRGLGLR